MDRDELIIQVKQEYADLASKDSQITTVNEAGNEISSEAYYEELLGKVLDGITKGRFDQFKSGTEIVEAVANNKTKYCI